jgi:hypothetical protein
MLCADVLTEVGPGGLLQGMWEAADKAMLLPAVEVIPWSEAVALLPPDPPPHPKATVNINVAPAGPNRVRLL